MANLFGKNKLKSVAQAIDTDEVQSFIDIVEKWHHDYHHGTLKQDKETSREQEYNQNFFKDILGYKEKPATPFNFEPKATTAVGQLPDAVVGYTDKANNIENLAAVVELKGASIPLDRPQRREGNMSPVQQGFKYKTQYRNCPFVIVSNFYEFRLYRDNQLDYELWTLDDLVNPDDDYFLFKTWYVLLRNENFITSKGASKTEQLLSDIRIQQEEIGKKFYKIYKRARLGLLRDIYANNTHVRNDIDFGIEKAQKIIDRIVFAAFAEDRGLLPDNTLQRVAQEAERNSFGISLWQALKGLFEAIDTGSDKLEIPGGYNGGLFKSDPKLNNLKISDVALRPVIELGNYNFSEDLSVNILGHIFEQSISDLEEIKAKVNEAQNLEVLNQNRRKKDGIFYTPDYIVRYIVENSLGTYLRESEERLKTEFKLHGDINDKTYAKREQQAYGKYQDFLQNVKVADPACGSGAFLVYVFDYLLAENKRVGDILGNTIFSSEAYVRDILRNNIYGVDLNEESVEITKLSLWLKSAQKGKKLTSLDNNIKCGNSLIDDFVIAGSKAFNWDKEFAEIMDSGGFDVVVGNPPYVRQELLGDQKPYLAEHYKVYANTTDLFAYFYEKALSVLRPNGLMSYISNSFAKTTGAGVVLRKYLQENSQIEKLLDFGTLKVFDGATTYPIILVLRNSKPSHEFEYFAVSKQYLGSLDAGFRSGSIKISQKSLAPGSWVFENTNSSALREKLSSQKTVKELFGKTYYGIKTSLNEAFIISDYQKLAFTTESSECSEVIKPFWEGKDLARWHSAVDGKYVIIFTQGSTKRMFGNLIESDALERMTQKYGGIMRHLLQFETAAKKRYDKGDYWWELRACAYYDLFEQPKITWPNLQNSGKFSYDDTGKYINAPAVMLPNDNKALLAVLNSRVVWYFLSGICVVRSGGYLEVKPQYFAQIPLPNNLSEHSSELSQLSDDAITFTSDLLEASSHFLQLVKSETQLNKLPVRLNNWWTFDFSDFLRALKAELSLRQKDELLGLFEKYRTECAKLSSQIRQTDHKIDQFVYKLYDLAPEEIAIIERINE
jgi:type I restriction-modification system DNA methylase subunit